MDLHVNESIKNTYRVFPMQGRMEYLRYDMNENPEGLPADFVAEVVREITPEFLAVYPEPDRFLNKYAAFLGVEKENLMVTNGSDMAIRYVLETFGEKGKDVITVAPSFEMYWVNCNILGYHHVPVAYEDDLTINVNKIVDAITEDTRIVVLLNPNNPVGNVYSEEELSSVIARAKEVGAVVLIDEAYHYFYPNTFLQHIRTDENVIILRTFSKMFSLAAVRLGVIISNPEIIRYCMNGRLTFDTNSVALLFGERILEHPEIVEQLIASEVEGKAWTLETLNAHGYETRECKGNFIFVRPHHNANEVTKRLETEKKLLVHDYKRAPLAPYIRVSVGSKRAMELFVNAFLEVDA